MLKRLEYNTPIVLEMDKRTDRYRVCPIGQHNIIIIGRAICLVSLSRGSENTN